MTNRPKQEVRTQGKVSVRIWPPLRAMLDRDLDSVGMKRDAFLDCVLRHEAQTLALEMPCPNSELAESALRKACRHYLSGRDAQVNLNLSKETAQLVADVCKEFRVPRDTFINRVILHLTLPDPELDACLYEIEGWDDLRVDVRDKIDEERSIIYAGSPLDAIGELLCHDPFWRRRKEIKLAQKQDPSLPPLLATQISPFYFFRWKEHSPWRIESSEWLNCCLPDERVEGTPEYVTAKERAELLLQEFTASLEAEVETGTSSGNHAAKGEPTDELE